MSTTVAPRPNLTDDISWDDLIKDFVQKRCILLLGPSTPLYLLDGEYLDFYSFISLHLAKSLVENHYPFDNTQVRNLSYTAHEFMTMKKTTYRPRLTDRIAEILRNNVPASLPADGLPELYRNIAQLPWHTIINTQPDTYLAPALHSKTEFYNYTHQKNTTQITEKDLLVYNLFGAIQKDGEDYNCDSLVLTEDDQLDFVRNIVRAAPPVPEGLLSRFDEGKRYIFLDFNLENWYFRLLMESLKLDKKYAPVSAKHSFIEFTPFTKAFYTSRYGFVFVPTDSAEFMRELQRRYSERQARPGTAPSRKKYNAVIAYHDDEEDIVRSFITQLNPWRQRNEINLWWRNESSIAGDVLDNEKNEMASADVIVLFISARFIEDHNNDHITDAISNAIAGNSQAKVFAVLARSSLWDDTDIKNLKYILPTDKKPLIGTRTQTTDEIMNETVKAFSNLLWQ